MARKPPFIEAHPAGYSDARAQGLVRAHCFCVVDGDTADFMLDLGFHQYAYVALRLARVNTAEIRGTSKRVRALALRAKARVDALLHDRPVLIRSDRQLTTFERFVAEVFLQLDPPGPAGVDKKSVSGHRWHNLSDVLLAEGLAVPIEGSD